jgi:hypothetical protein
MISMIPNGPWYYGLSLPPRFTWSVNACQGSAGKVSILLPSVLTTGLPGSVAATDAPRRRPVKA